MQLVPFVVIHDDCVLSKALQKVDCFVVFCFAKYKTRPVSKSSKTIETNWKFCNCKIFSKLTKIFAKHFLALKCMFLSSFVFQNLQNMASFHSFKCIENIVLKSFQKFYEKIV